MILGNGVTGLLEGSLDLNWLRQQLISDNIANADTPGYQRQDINFSQALEQAVNGTATVQMAKTDPKHLDSGESALSPSLAAGISNIRNDGNNVDLENELAQQAMTLLQYSLLSRLESDQLGLLRTAISEGRR